MLLITIVIAYLITGITCVVWDFRQPYLDRPAYARRPERYAKGFPMVIFGWLPISVLEASMSRQWGRAVKRMTTFALLVGGGAMMMA